jgi:hypothetical protein
MGLHEARLVRELRPDARLEEIVRAALAVVTE